MDLSTTNATFSARAEQKVRHYVIMSLCHYVIMSLCHYVIMVWASTCSSRLTKDHTLSILFVLQKEPPMCWKLTRRCRGMRLLPPY